MISDNLYRFLRVWPFGQKMFRKVVKRLPHRLRRVHHFGRDLLIDPTELHGFYLYYEHEYDDPIFQFLERELVSFDWALDLGANIGIYTTYLAKKCAHVDAFEPEAQVMDKLNKNLEINNIRNVTIHRECVSDITGSVNFVSPTSENQGVGHIGGAGQSVKSISIDDFLANREQKPIFIKMDIEGGEWLAANGAKNVFQNWNMPLRILLELHPTEITELGGSVAQLKERFESCGLKVMSLDDGQLKEVSSESRFWWVANQY